MKIAKMADWVQKGNTPKQVFDKFQLKTMQRAILNCLQVSDVVANLPTGFGKSLLFQYPASLQKINMKCIIVIVPLKALLWDTIREAQDLGITAKQIDSYVINDYYRNDKLPQMLVTTPQKIFATQNTFNFIQSLYSLQKLRLLVIDQCHCISQWGHDFRPAYLKLQKLRQSLSGVRLLAISATITPQSRADLAKRLFLFNAHYFQASYHRSNLFYDVIKCKQKSEIKDTIYNYLSKKKLVQKQGIIYCQTISASEQLSSLLSAELSVGLFHSKLSQKMRRQVYDGFMEGKIKTIIGTICFGMGINKKDIRYVINVGISKSPQNYYQQSGRAGRDGLQSQCVIISYPSQAAPLYFLVSRSQISKKQKSHQIAKIQQIKQYCQQQTQCRRKSLFRFLGQNFNSELCQSKCDMCCLLDSGVVIKQVDYYAQVKKILQKLQESKLSFTKKQISGYLKGKSINSVKRGKSSQLFIGQQIKGIFAKQKIQTIQKIVQGMIHQNILVNQVRKMKSKFFVPYFKAANKNSTRNFKEFTISVQEKPTTGQQNMNQKNKNKFERFLEKKGMSAAQLPKTAKSLDFLVPKKAESNQNECLIQAEVVKQRQNYQSFFCDLFGQQLGQKNNGSEQDYQNDQIIGQIEINNQEIEQEPHYIEQISKQQQNVQQVDKLIEQYLRNRETLDKKLKQQQANLKRKTINFKQISEHEK